VNAAFFGSRSISQSDTSLSRQLPERQRGVSLTAQPAAPRNGRGGSVETG